MRTTAGGDDAGDAADADDLLDRQAEHGQRVGDASIDVVVGSPKSTYS